MWITGHQKKLKQCDFNSIVKELAYDLQDDEARLLLIQFLKHNIGFTWNLISGVELMPIQEILLRGLILRDNALIVAGRGSSKTSALDSIISTKNGLKYLKDVLIGEEILGIKDFNKVECKRINPVEPGFKITTHRGYSSEVKWNHQFYVFDEHMNFIWKEAKDIKEGDYIVLRQGENRWNEKQLEDLDWYYYLGLIIGDGHINENSIGITTNDQDIINFLSNFYNQLGIKFHIGKKQKTTAVSVVSYNKSIIKRIVDSGISVDSRSWNKRIPHCVFSASQLEVQSFIKGMYDTDGYSCLRTKNKYSKVTYNLSIGYTSVSEKLIKELQIFLLNFGVISSYGISHDAGAFVQNGKIYNKRTTYTLTIRDYANILNFNDKIGFGLNRKQKGIFTYLDNCLNLKNNDSRKIPYLSQWIKSKYKWSRSKYGKLFKTVSYLTAKGLIEKGLFDKEDIEKINYIINNKLFFEQVIKKEAKDIQTCSIQVENEACYWDNGLVSHNSFSISTFCAIFPIFFSNSKLCLISTNFRNSRRLFENSEKMIRGKNADLLSACYTNEPSRRNDILSWKLENESEVFALPLSTGEGLRGTRASVVLVDEGLLITKEIQEYIIRPFLSARHDFTEQENIRKIENQLIQQGMMNEADRTQFNTNKYLVFSSASYEFEYLYQMYRSYIDMITKQAVEKDEKSPTYFVMKFSYEAFPTNSFLDLNAIEAAKASGGENSEYFKREYRALFTSGNDGFFDIKKIYKCRIPDTSFPTVQVKGTKDAKYILAIDPSYSKAMNSDYFAMAVYMLIPEKREIMLVHSYGRAGADLNQHYAYLTYLLTHFNIVYTIIDASGTEFIDGYNESFIAKQKEIQLGMFSPDVNFNKDNYLEMIQKAKQQYNISNRKFVYPQLFSSDSNRRMNEHLQGGIAAEKIWFASRICANDRAFNVTKDFKLPFEFKDPKGENIMSTLEFLEEQDNWIQETINQLALIEVRSTSTGNMMYDLPVKVRQNDGPDKARRDNYTCCLLAYYGAKHYYDMIFTPVEEINTTFTPFCV